MLCASSRRDTDAVCVSEREKHRPAYLYTKQNQDASLFWISQHGHPNNACIAMFLTISSGQIINCVHLPSQTPRHATVCNPQRRCQGQGGITPFFPSHLIHPRPSLPYAITSHPADHKRYNHTQQPRAIQVCPWPANRHASKPDTEPARPWPPASASAPQTPQSCRHGGRSHPSGTGPPTYRPRRSRRSRRGARACRYSAA